MSKSNKLVNPLLKRVPRELRGDWKKYAVVAVFLVLMIGFISGMYVANKSMLSAADDGADKYNLEDGHFQVMKELDEGELKEIEKLDIKLYENYFVNTDEDNDNDGVPDGTIRVYRSSDSINQACVLKGRFPENEKEIAIDRMHADNMGVKPGDKIGVGDKEYEVVGLIAYVNYATLHEKPTDFMFDALTFDVGMLTDEGFERLGDDVSYSYAWTYNEDPEDDKEEKHMSDELMHGLYTTIAAQGNELEAYLPKYANPAINYAKEDISGDITIMSMVVYILVVIIAFIFAITISNTVVKESSTIGTLRASGYTRGELLVHLMTMPVIVVLMSAIVGNILGYTVFKDVVVSMYYGSYSLPTYVTIWSTEAFIKTTFTPVLLMFVINFVVISRMLKKSPLQFLKHDFKKKKRKKAIRLPRWKFFNRFRMRIMLQNIPNYLTMLIGILFVVIMLVFAVGMTDTLEHYKDNAENMMISRYQYVVSSYIDEQGKALASSNTDAERFCMTTLKKVTGSFSEDITVYGIENNSRYVNINNITALAENEVYISRSFCDKYGYEAGDRIKLEEEYDDKSYTFEVKGIYENAPTLSLYMSNENYLKVFGGEDGAFSGFFSDSELTDIDDAYIATVITKKEITKMCDQLDVSMGATLGYFQYLCVILAAVLIYLLSKIIIEKNENAISMTKILGYHNKEIAGLYLVSTAVVVVLADALSVFAGIKIMQLIWNQFMMQYSGWFDFVVSLEGEFKIFAFVIIGYVLVTYFDYKRIKKIPMDEALKNVE